MIPDIGWIELLIIASVAIIVVGPKDLPRLMRVLGGWVGKARGLAREFQKSFDDLVRESELDDLRKEVEELRAMNPIEEIKKSLDPTDDLRALDKSLKEDMADVEADMKEKREEDPKSEEPVDFGADLFADQDKKQDERLAETQTHDDAGTVKP